MQVFIKTITGETYCVDVEKTDTISKMKTKIYNAMGLEPAYQYLVHGKNVLEVHGGATVGDYGIEARAKIQLTKRMRGG
ncbi:unnamed protein product [Arabidopsis lyrata]|uniref:Ubiquitin-like domain-containing protein n=1 Tax=Arabidopsis lyrata subsp. lyrata TaxID=81972 RepID=D7M214_ARALL|nr:ubiquitin [Arabidopsis lyrata subsp. lyrata]EFH49646.1 hypothetical protein ARALYDRAFT_908866 [Arabidopsis lyrata subsp. lyrata]CAH8270547.1 unnamed protein product [Arabidopsis lyrata]|eukprot:XP_002873387.1 ubiquitin [Arabidopsis lyrata subsp. lyrata]